jgi:hypothetical protein
MSTCPRTPELVRLLDGELTENRAAGVRAHLDACAACTAELDAQRTLVGRIAAPIPELRLDEALSSVMRRLDLAEAAHVPLRPRRVAGLAVPALGGLAAAAVVLVALALSPDRAPDRGEFSARGASVAWSRKVGVELWALEGGPRRLSAGDRLAPGVALVGAFSNVDAAPAHLLAFALDGHGDVHWLYPAFDDPGSDPASVRLEGSVIQRALPESVILQDVPPGPLRFVLVVSREPLRVSSIESVGVAGRTPAALRARWPAARVDELDVIFGALPATSPEVRP